MTVEQTGPIKTAKIRMHGERDTEADMFLRLGMGEGEIGEDKFTVGTSPGGDIVWYFEGDRYYSISLRDLTNDVVAFREEVRMKKP